ncbi:leucine-rich repeat-containing protein 71 [Amia ocellicauda]|uniref:leucine-rich repeat-containing protein 71 n=1 Tax=Amia ocellicauda TaxID=2972642 RepID=UPI003463F871
MLSMVTPGRGRRSEFRMGKKTDKVQKEKADRGSAGIEEDSSKTAGLSFQDKVTAQTIEEYQCTGNLEVDFPELCALMGIREIPPVTPRPHQAATPTMDQSLLEESQSQLDTTSSSLRPRLQVELEGDDPRSVREVRIRGWKVDERMAKILSKCLPSLNNTHTLHLWRVGLTHRTLTSLCCTVPLCPSLRSVVIEGTPIPEQSFHLLISEDSQLAHLSLRNNRIDEEGARLIGRALSMPSSANKSLLSLNLSFNHLRDAGAQHLARGLRLNRSLLCLSLAHNGIGDEGAASLAQVLSTFPLSHEETVERRRLSERESPDRHPSTQRSESKADRPPSHPSSASLERSSKGNKSGPKRRDKDPTKKEEKASANQGTGAGASVKKEEAKATKKGSDTKVSRGRGVRSGGKEKNPPVAEQEDKSSNVLIKTAEPPEPVSPLLDTAEHREGRVFIPGNHALTSLNLSGNAISEVSLWAFLSCLRAQGDAVPRGGLLRLSLTRNHFPPDCEAFLRIQEVMSQRDPLLRNGEEELHG